MDPPYFVWYNNPYEFGLQGSCKNWKLISCLISELWFKLITYDNAARNQKDLWKAQQETAKYCKLQKRKGQELPHFWKDKLLWFEQRWFVKQSILTYILEIENENIVTSHLD